MGRDVVDQCAKLIADQYDLRWLDVSRRYVGLCEGVILDVVTDDQYVQLNFLAIGPPWHELLKSDYRGLSLTRAMGVTDSWIYPCTTEHGTYGCGVRLNEERIEDLGIESLVKMPATLAKDLHALGASDSCPCQICGLVPARLVSLIDFTLVPVCESCQTISVLPSPQITASATPTLNWTMALPTLGAMTAIGAVTWAGIQTLKNLHYLVLFLPIVWSFGLCIWIVSIAGGINRALRALLFLSVMTSVMVGNIWGYHAFLIKQLRKQFPKIDLEVTWIDVVVNYFQSLPQTWTNEFPFYLGGFVGAWIAVKWKHDRQMILVE